MKKKSKDKLNFKQIGMIFVSLLTVIIDIVVLGVLENKISQKDLWWLVLGIIAISTAMFFTIWHLAGKLLVDIHYSDNRNISKNCAVKDGKCCGQAVCDSLAVHYNVIPQEEEKKTLANEYGLYLQPHIKEIEEFSQKRGKEVWIISSNLNSEIFLDTESGVSSQVKINVEKGIEYFYLYFESPDDPELIKRNKKNIKESLKHAKNVHFVSLGDQKNVPDEYILYLYGVVIYVYDDGEYEGYFSLRNHEIDKIIEPIYMKMPICMAGQYYNVMKEAWKTQQIKNEQQHVTIREIDVDQLLLAKSFILDCHKDLENKDFFFVGDIDTALQETFKTGFVYGAFCGEELVGIQGIDLSEKNQKSISPCIELFLNNKPLAELGWTMVKKNFQCRGIASLLILQAEKKVLDEYDFVATVHPQNIASLRVYLSNGYCGVKLGKYYGQTRIFLMKRQNVPFEFDRTITEHLLAGIREDYFADEIALVGVVKKNHTYYGQFAKLI